VHKTGEEIRIEMSLAPVSPIDDAAAGGRLALAIIRYITERKRIEERLRESEGRSAPLSRTR
jgi:PAS domain-containing protein